MYPIILNLGIVQISSFGLFLFLALLLGMFIVWRNARDRGIVDEKIFDNLMVVSMSTLIFTRLMFVLTHFNLFQVNLLRIFLVWRFPGLSFWGAFIGGLIVFVIYSNKQKLPLGVMFDGYGLAILPVLILSAIGLWLDGSLIGKVTNFKWGVLAVGVSEKRHPIALYTIILAVIASLLVIIVRRKINLKNYPYGLTGWIVLSSLGFIQLVLAFFRSDLLYLDSLVSIEQVLGIILFIGPSGPIYIGFNLKAKLKIFLDNLKNYYKRK